MKVDKDEENYFLRTIHPNLKDVI